MASSGAPTPSRRGSDPHAGLPRAVAGCESPWARKDGSAQIRTAATGWELADVAPASSRAVRADRPEEHVRRPKRRAPPARQRPRRVSSHAEGESCARRPRRVRPIQPSRAARLALGGRADLGRRRELAFAPRSQDPETETSLTRRPTTMAGRSPGSSPEAPRRAALPRASPRAPRHPPVRWASAAPRSGGCTEITGFEPLTLSITMTLGLAERPVIRAAEHALCGSARTSGAGRAGSG